MSNEIWKQIPMFPTYAASNTGKIKNIKRDKEIAQTDVDIRQYKNVSISYKNKAYTKKVSRLVWAAFHGCECPETVDHIDGNVANNHIDNLQCLTMKDNTHRRRSYAKTNKYKLSDDKKREILTKYLDGVSVWNISREYSIPPNYLYTTFKRGSWNHLCWKDDTENI